MSTSQLCIRNEWNTNKMMIWMRTQFYFILINYIKKNQILTFDPKTKSKKNDIDLASRYILCCYNE